MGMKRHGSSRKPVLNLDSSKDLSPRPTWKSKYEQICASHETNGNEPSDMKETKVTTALHGLSGYLSSDSSSDDVSEPDLDLEKEVESFIKEIDDLKLDLPKKSQPPSTDSKNEAPVDSTTSLEASSSNDPSMPPAPTVAWQECYDGSTGFTYYWNVETNEVTWEMPLEYQSYLEALKQWQQYRAHGVVAMIQQVRAQQQQQLQLQMSQQQPPKPEGELVFPHRSKKKKKKKNEFEDEKIELITSYGPNSGDESSDEDKALPPVKLPPPKKRSEKKSSSSGVTSSSPSQPIGPHLPPARLKKLYNLKERLVPKKLPSLPEVDKKPQTEKEPKKESKHRNKHKHSKVVSIEEPIKPKTAPKPKTPPPPLIIEKRFVVEEPVDSHVTEVPINNAVEVKEVVMAASPDRNSKKDKLPVTCSDVEDEVNDEDGSSVKEIKSKSMKLKLSKRGKALINASVATAKARATDFVETPQGLIHIENMEGQTKTDEVSSETPTKLSNEPIKRKHQGRTDGSSLNLDPHQIPTNTEGTKKLRVSAANFYKDRSIDIKSTPSIEGIDEKAKLNLDIKDTFDVLSDKMKYLCEAKEPVSPVQVLTIQLQTLVGAWECHVLKEEYLKGWLLRTKLDLEQLESSVAPSGWLCQWQREEKRYCYRNIATGEVSWEFPRSEDIGLAAADTFGGEEEMELCTTPPPLAATPPPPPGISSQPTSPPPTPSPPPPPHISSEDPPIPENPPLPTETPPLPPLPPPPEDPPSPIPPPPPPEEDSPPPLPPTPLGHHLNQPLPPGVDPPEYVHQPPLPPQHPAPDYNHLHLQIPISMHMMQTIHHYPMTPSPYQSVHVGGSGLGSVAINSLAPSNVNRMVNAPPLPSSPIGGRRGSGESAIPASHDLSSELNNFYNDLATLEPSPPPPLPSPPPLPPAPPPPDHSPSPQPLAAPSTPPPQLVNKKKKKSKLAPGLSLKKKGVPSLVAKWQQVQQDVRRDMKTIEPDSS